MKTTLKGSQIVLRSKTPDLVRQEFYGLVIAHYAIRKLMQEASLGPRDTQTAGQGAPPDALSFKQAVNTVRRKLPVYGASTSSHTRYGVCHVPCLSVKFFLGTVSLQHYSTLPRYSAAGCARERGALDCQCPS
jgi:hypothetical protein